MKNILIIGGAGFIGTNVAEFYAKNGKMVVVYDNLSRKGSECNLSYLQTKYPNNISFVKGDITHTNQLHKLQSLMMNADLILHLAAQVAVTTSVKNPREDFRINALGTFNVLESLRYCNSKTGKNPTLIYSSTNKVYGGMEDLEIIDTGSEYAYKNLPMGITEDRCLDFHSPYGCSKGCGDQYVRDYSRIFGLNTVVFRQSCIYGERQFGVEDQGWVAWFIIANNIKKPITIYGDGKQVRDILWVGDLVRAYDMVHKKIKKTTGKCYNIGGGPKNTMSLLYLISHIEKENGNTFDKTFGEWRVGDQKICVMDISKAKQDFGWEPTISTNEGVNKLNNWVKKNIAEIAPFFN